MQIIAVCDHFASLLILKFNVSLRLRKLDTKKKQLTRLEEQLHKLEVQATDKVCVQ